MIANQIILKKIKITSLQLYMFVIEQLQVSISYFQKIINVHKNENLNKITSPSNLLEYLFVYLQKKG